MHVSIKNIGPRPFNKIKTKRYNANHFWEPFAGMDEMPFALDVGVVHVHLPHSSGPSKSTSVHDYVSAKIPLQYLDACEA